MLIDSRGTTIISNPYPHNAAYRRLETACVGGPRRIDLLARFGELGARARGEIWKCSLQPNLQLDDSLGALRSEPGCTQRPAPMLDTSLRSLRLVKVLLLCYSVTPTHSLFPLQRDEKGEYDPSHPVTGTRQDRRDVLGSRMASPL